MMSDHPLLEQKLDNLQQEFRIFRDNHFYHFERKVNEKLDALDITIKDKKMLIGIGATFVVVLIDLLSHLI